MSADRKVIYLDNAATTKVYPEAAAAALHYYTDEYYNPSALYAYSLDVRRELEKNTERLAGLLGASKDEIIFTSGATESNNYALECGFKNKKGNLIISGGEHASVYEKAMQMKSAGADVRIVPLVKNGGIDAERLFNAVDGDTAFVSVIHASNETGVINDIKYLCAAVKSKNPRVVFHSDGVQAAFKTKFDFASSGIDLYSISAHKVGGLKGVGALLVRRGFNMKPYIHGGGQQDGRRSGTENVGGIIAFAHAAEKYRAAASGFDAPGLRQRLIEKIIPEIDFVTYVGGDNNTGYILSLSFSGIKGEVLAHMLEGKGILIGLGAACATHSKKPRVLIQLGLNQKETDGSVRISFCPETDINDVMYAADEIIIAAKKLKGIING